MRHVRIGTGWLVVVLMCLFADLAGFASPAGTADGTNSGPPAPPSAELPFILDHNRMIVDVDFIRPSGTLRKARAWVDTGNQHLLVGEALARDLGLEPAEPGESGTQYAQVWARSTPPLRLGGMTLDTGGIRTRILPGAGILPGVPAEANLPASALRRLHVVFDYPAGRLTVARSGVLKPRGVAIPCLVHDETGLFQIAVTVDGETAQFGVDNGSAGTWVSGTLTAAWQSRHPDRPRATGAVGSTNFFGFPFESMGVLMRLPELGIGTLRARDVGLLGIGQELFDWYSKKTAAPVVGFVGANVLRGFRLEVDYPNRMTYWEAGPPPEAGDLDIVGLTLRPEADGGYTIAGIASRNGTAVVAGVQAGDKLVRVDDLNVAGATMGTVARALRGAPGAVRRLVVQREGQTIAVDAPVMRLP